MFCWNGYGIDRKLDEIDRRLAEWRDKEIANRIRILKITLWASVIVGVFSLIYSYVTVVLFPKPGSENNGFTLSRIDEWTGAADMPWRLRSDDGSAD